MTPVAERCWYVNTYNRFNAPGLTYPQPQYVVTPRALVEFHSPTGNINTMFAAELGYIMAATLECCHTEGQRRTRGQEQTRPCQITPCAVARQVQPESLECAATPFDTKAGHPHGDHLDTAAKTLTHTATSQHAGNLTATPPPSCSHPPRPHNYTPPL